MKARNFVNLMNPIHLNWAASVLNMQMNPKNGPDLIDDEKIVEIKFALIHPTKNYTKAWTVFDYQMEYANGKVGYWGLGTYKLHTQVENIETETPKKLEKIVSERQLHLVSWDWMQQFPPHETSGSTYISKWDNTLRYPKLRLLPRKTKSYDVQKGQIHLTRGVSPRSFTIATAEAPF
jgi:hypothetical protein